jgi:hypothetical protein
MEQEGNKINYADPYWKTADNGGKRCYFDINHIFPLVPYRYGNFYLYGPRNAMLHLNKCYGPDWNSMGQTLYDHRTGEWTKGVKRELSSTDFLTLRPPTSTLDNTLRGVLCSDNKADCTTYRGEVRENKKSKKSSRKVSKKSSRKVSKKSSRKVSKKNSKKVSKKSSRKVKRK